MDKKEIAEEEREKMLNAENTKHTGAAPAPDLECDEQKPRKKIPIGGIKMPGFCRTKSKEPCKVSGGEIYLKETIQTRTGRQMHSPLYASAFLCSCSLIFLIQKSPAALILLSTQPGCRAARL